jgi:hypothetical protein
LCGCCFHFIEVRQCHSWLDVLESDLQVHDSVMVWKAVRRVEQQRAAACCN